MARFVFKLQSHLTHSVEVIFGAQASISLLNIKMVDVPEDCTTIWVTMVDIMKKLISHGAVLENIDVDALMKELNIYIEPNLLTASIKTSVDNAMEHSN